jgi:hypothetical protein
MMLAMPLKSVSASIKDGRDGINGTGWKRWQRWKKQAEMAQRVIRVSVVKMGVMEWMVLMVFLSTNARIDFDGSVLSLLCLLVLSSMLVRLLLLTLQNRIKVITNGGGTSQSVLDTLASLQTQITNLIPSQTGNSGKYLTTNGTATFMGIYCWRWIKLSRNLERFNKYPYSYL